MDKVQKVSRGDSAKMKATITNPDSEYCGKYGIVFSASDFITDREYIFELNDEDVPYNLAVDEGDFIDGYLLLNNRSDGVGEFLRELAASTKNYPRKLRAMVDGGYQGVTENAVYTLTRGKSL